MGQRQGGSEMDSTKWAAAVVPVAAGAVSRTRPCGVGRRAGDSGRGATFDTDLPTAVTHR